MGMSNKEIQDVIEYSKMELSIVEKRRDQKKRYDKKQKTTENLPDVNQLQSLYKVFREAGETGRKDHLKTAAKKAESFDNRFSTDYVGQLNKHLNCGCRNIKKNGIFSKSNGLKEQAQATFHVLADELQSQLGFEETHPEEKEATAEERNKDKKYKHVPSTIHGEHLLERYEKTDPKPNAPG